MENKKYSILIIGLYVKLHLKGIIDHLKYRNPMVDITLLTDKPNEMRDFLDHKDIEIVHYDVPPVNIKNRWLRSLVIKHRQRSFFRRFSKGKKYDIINIHFPNKYMSYVIKNLRHMTKRIVISPWGSDVLRRSEKDLKILAKLYKDADYIATSAKIPLGEKIIQEFSVPSKKIVGNFFGSDVIDYAIDYGNTISQEDAKKRYSITGKYVITCGYNQRRQQHHKEIIAAIAQVKDKLPDNLTLLFPMTYGNSNNETSIEECKNDCAKYGLDAVFVTEFLSVEDIYKLRMATDMFVHVQTTDANSGSVQEYIICNKKIVHGSWIKYEEFEAYKPLFYFPVDKMENLGGTIVKAYQSEKIDIPKGVIEEVEKKSWKHKSTKMNEFFMSITHNKD